MQEDMEANAHGQWVGLYNVGKAGPTFVICCSVEVTSSTLHKHHLVLHITEKCYRVDTHAR